MTPPPGRSVVGTWRVARTEIPPPYNPAHEIHHLTPDGIYLSEYFDIDKWRIGARFGHEPTENGARIFSRNGRPVPNAPPRFEGDLLVLTGSHGLSSWLERIPSAELPEGLTRYYDPPASPEDGSPAA